MISGAAGTSTCAVWRRGDGARATSPATSEIVDHFRRGHPPADQLRRDRRRRDRRLEDDSGQSPDRSTRTRSCGRARSTAMREPAALARLAHPALRRGSTRLVGRAWGAGRTRPGCAGRRRSARRERDGGVARRRPSRSVSVRSGARKRSAKASDFCPSADLVAGVDVEEPDRLEQLPAPSRSAASTSAAATEASTTSATSSLATGYVENAAPARRRARSSSTSRSISAAAVRAGHAVGLADLGCSSPAWPTTTSPTENSAQRPGCHGPRLAARTLTSTPRPRDAGAPRRRVGPDRPARPRPHQPARSRSPASTRRGAAAGRAAPCRARRARRRSGGGRPPRIGAGARVRAGTPGPVSKSATSGAPRPTLRASAFSSPGAASWSSAAPRTRAGWPAARWRRSSSAGRPSASRSAAPTNGKLTTST